MLQSIQEETATNIYYPSPLQDLLGSDPNGSGPAASRNSHVIWITGEFFGVQRARDMLFQVSLSKVCLKFTTSCFIFVMPNFRTKWSSPETLQFFPEN